MAIKGVIYSNQHVSAADHAALFRMVVGDGVLDGCGISKSRNVCTISAGKFVTAGRLIRIIGQETIDIPVTQNNVYARIRGVNDMDRLATRQVFEQFYFTVDYANSADGFPALVQEDINVNGKIYEVEWAVLRIGSEGIIEEIVRHIGDAQPGSGGGGEVSFVRLQDITFTGNQNDLIYTADGDNWEIAILNNGTLTFRVNPGNIDVFAVGGGGVGNSGHNDNGVSKGGRGGQGGEAKTSFGVTGIRNNPYLIVIGGSGESTSFGSGEDAITAIGGGLAGCQGIIGGSGAEVSFNTLVNPPTANAIDSDAGNSGSKAFDGAGSINSALDNTLFGSSGGGGGAKITVSGIEVHRGPSSGGNTSTDTQTYPPSAYGKGGDYDGDPHALAGRVNTGQGGGGGECNEYSGANGALGGSGIVIIRNSRSRPAA